MNTQNVMTLRKWIFKIKRLSIVLIIALFSIIAKAQTGGCLVDFLATDLKQTNGKLKTYFNSLAEGKGAKLWIEIFNASKTNARANINTLTLFNKLDNLRSLKTKLLDKLTDEQLIKFSKDFVEATPAVLKQFDDNIGLIDAWKLLDDAGRNALKLDTDLLAKITKCINHPELAKIGIDDDYLVDIAKALAGDHSQAGVKIIIEGVETTLTTTKAKLLEAEIFDVISSFGGYLKSNPPSNYTNLYEKVIKPLRGSLFSNRKGAVGVLKFLKDPTANIAGKKLLFEETITNARGTNSFIDVVIDGVRHEIKNCADCVSSKTIREQFIQRDLYNASSIEDITKWKIYEQGYTKDNLISHLNANKDAIESLGAEKISQILNDDISDLTISQASKNLINRIPRGSASGVA